MFVSLLSRCLPVRFYPSTSRFCQPFRLLCSPCVETLFEFLAVLQIAAGLFLLWQGIQWLSYLRGRFAPHPRFFAPPTPLPSPFPGLEPRPPPKLLPPSQFPPHNFQIFFIPPSPTH